MTSFSEARNAYTRGRIAGAGPLDLLLMAYEVAVTACRRNDSPRAIQALVLLEGVLDFSHGEDAAAGLLRIYRYCEELVRNGQHEEAGRWLAELGEAWSDARREMRKVEKKVAIARKRPRAV